MREGKSIMYFFLNLQGPSFLISCCYMLYPESYLENKDKHNKAQQKISLFKQPFSKRTLFYWVLNKKEHFFYWIFSFWVFLNKKIVFLLHFKKGGFKNSKHILPRQALAMLHSCLNVCNSRCLFHNFNLKLGRSIFLLRISDELGLKL